MEKLILSFKNISKKSFGISILSVTAQFKIFLLPKSGLLSDQSSYLTHQFSQFISIIQCIEIIFILIISQISIVSLIIHVSTITARSTFQMPT